MAVTYQMKSYTKVVVMNAQDIITINFLIYFNNRLGTMFCYTALSEEFDILTVSSFWGFLHIQCFPSCFYLLIYLILITLYYLYSQLH